jgi:hypothetical protein
MKRISARLLLLPLVLTSVLAVTAGNAAAVTFSRTVVAVGEGVTRQAVVADFNNDGEDDLAVARGPVDVLLGQAGTGFGAPNVVLGGANEALAVADFNDDGNPDLASARSLGGVVIMIGRGDGTFSAGPGYETDGRPHTIAAGDFNRDTDYDLVTANRGSGTVSVFPGAAGSTFGARQDFEAGPTPVSLGLGDFDRDFDFDLVTANEATNTVSVMRGQDGLAFGPPESFEVGQVPSAVTVGMFNGDEEFDLAVANRSSDSVSVLFGTTDGPLFGPRHDVAVGNAPVAVAVGDFNGDHRQDIVTADAIDDGVSLLVGKGDGTFDRLRGLVAGPKPTSVATGDFNRDGDLDLVVGEEDSDDVSVLVNNAQPAMSWGPSPLVFPHTDVGATSARKDVTVGNGGEGGLDLTSVALEGGDSDQFVIVSQNCTTRSIRPGESCTIGIRFRPTLNGPLETSLRFRMEGLNGAIDSPVTGIGGPPPAPAFAVSPANLAFGDQRIKTTSAAKRLTVTNTGTANLAVASTDLAGTDATQFVVSADSCEGKTVAPGGTCTVDVRFKPARPGTKNATLTFTHNAPASPHTVALTGRGTGICLPLLCVAGAEPANPLAP